MSPSIKDLEAFRESLDADRYYVVSNENYARATPNAMSHKDLQGLYEKSKQPNGKAKLMEGSVKWHQNLLG